MNIITCKQGSPEWVQHRLGLPTASEFDRIIQPSTGKLSTQADKYLARLLAEWYLGAPVNDYVSDYMARGTELETEARAWYEFESGHEVEEVGLCVSDCGRYGCSPDGLIGTTGGLELKSPGAEKHFYSVLNPDKFVADHKCQVQGGLWICEREWWDVCSFNPNGPRVRVTVQRDEPFIEAMSAAVREFCDRLEALKRKYAPEREQRLEEVALNADHPF